MIYESLTCFVYVFTLYKIIERIIAIKIKITSFTRKEGSIGRFALECISVTFFLFLFSERTVSRGSREETRQRSTVRWHSFVLSSHALRSAALDARSALAKTRGDYLSDDKNAEKFSIMYTTCRSNLGIIDREVILYERINRACRTIFFHTTFPENRVSQSDKDMRTWLIHDNRVNNLQHVILCVKIILRYSSCLYT